ncbi:glycoside hydrolase family 5 protein [Flavobacteriaceae bacterium MHTCC 0001]
MKIKYIILVLVAASLVSCTTTDDSNGIPYVSYFNEEVTSADDGVMRDITSMQLTSEMGTGINLGNTLDTKDEDLTVWGNPIPTKEMIDAFAARGFKTLRIPVTWQYHMEDTTPYKIEKSWLDLVMRVVNWARENNMYVIINTHHEEEWLIPTYEKEDEVISRITSLWTQIANRFKDYSDYLIFETLNEPRHKDTPEEWSGGTAEGRDVVNKYHKAALDAIRNTGGNNLKRHVMVSTYAASAVQEAYDDYVIPNNDERVIVSLHHYVPFGFALGGLTNQWGTDEEKAELDALFDRIHDKWISQGRAVVMGEWGAFNDNIDARLEHAEYYANGCASTGIVAVWWDTGGLMDRRTLIWPEGNIADVLVNATK